LLELLEVPARISCRRGDLHQVWRAPREWPAADHFRNGAVLARGR